MSKYDTKSNLDLRALKMWAAMGFDVLSCQMRKKVSFMSVSASSMPVSAARTPMGNEHRLFAFLKYHTYLAAQSL